MTDPMNTLDPMNTCGAPDCERQSARYYRRKAA